MITSQVRRVPFTKIKMVFLVHVIFPSHILLRNGRCVSVCRVLTWHAQSPGDANSGPHAVEQTLLSKPSLSPRAIFYGVLIDGLQKLQVKTRWENCVQYVKKHVKNHVKPCKKAGPGELLGGLSPSPFLLPSSQAIRSFISGMLPPCCNRPKRLWTKSKLKPK